MDTKKQPVPENIALASDVFDQFCSASTLKTILGHFRHLCDLLRVKPTVFPQFYPKLKSKLRSWKAQALWVKFDKRASHKCYNRGKACPNTRVLIIGAGPCGLRTAIEAQLLGAKVVVVEKRDRISRNNVLHLWPFVIQDLKALGAKKFFGKFCAGAIDHISIRQLQCILLKVALILGVEIHEGVGFEGLIPPPDNQSEEKTGWRASVSPADHPVSQYEFDVLIGADGKRNTLEGFKRKEFRGKLAIAITANFINRRSEAEARVEEISGVAFIFNQKFFKDLYAKTGIDLENIVYYKDETHYFVMTAKKHSLIEKGVIIQDFPDTAKLLSPENVDKAALQNYAREAADFSTNYKLPEMEFAVNHYGQPDVAMFDFTSMFAAENASRVVERRGHKLLKILVGDSLLEPFWPTGSGCARGFLSSMDACWAIKSWGSGQITPLEVLAERESIYRILGQTTPENLHRDHASYTLDPHTRYPNLNSRCVLPLQARTFYETDDPAGIEQPHITSPHEMPKKRRRKDSQVHPDTLLHWLKKQVALYDNVQIEDMSTSFKNGLALCAIIHRYRPDLIDFHSLKAENVASNNQLAFDMLDRELGVTPVMTGIEMEECEVPDKLTMLSYLSQIYDIFRGEIPHIKHPKLEPEDAPEPAPSITNQLRELSRHQKVHLLSRLTSQQHHHHPRPSASRKRSAADHVAGTTSAVTGDKKADSLRRQQQRKKRSLDREKVGVNVAERQKRMEEIQKNRVERQIHRQYLRKLATQQFYKSMQMLECNSKDEDSIPFEDYSLFLYRQTAPNFEDRVKELERKLLYPDREPRLSEDVRKGAPDEEFSGRIKTFEDRLKGTGPVQKKPKDLNRAIGKIETDDWNVKAIEKKIQENKMGRISKHERPEKVPKWSREQFNDKFQAVKSKLQRKGHNSNTPTKYADIDVTLKRVDKKLKEGDVLDMGQRGSNKVSAMAEQFAVKSQPELEKPTIQKSNSRAALVLPAQGSSETCHFCDKRVYLMERISAEGKFFHRGCFRCEYCNTSLRLGNYSFDRDGKSGSRFYCLQHVGYMGTQRIKMRRKSEELKFGTDKENIPVKITSKTSEKAKSLAETPPRLVAADVFDSKTTPERIEFENLIGPASDVEEAPSEMDEDEWTDRNFGASAAECSSDSSSGVSDSEEEANEVFEEALDEPLPVTADATRLLAETWSRRYSNKIPAEAQNGDRKKKHEAKPADEDEEEESESYGYEGSDADSYQEYDSDDDESDTATEGEDDIRAREQRLEELPKERKDSDTDSDTEVASDEYTSTEPESEEIENSATEIETDSEFELDGTTPTHEIPAIYINDSNITYRQNHCQEEPKRVQVRASHITRPVNGTVGKPQLPQGVKLKFSPLCPDADAGKSASLSNLSGGIVSTKNNNNNHPRPVIPTPIINPRRGDYLLNRTHSTEGIASKLSLELKKKYLLGASGLSGSVKKSGSASTLDSKFKSLVDMISEHQKLLQPAAEPSPTMQAFLQGTSKLGSSMSPPSPTVLSPPIKLPPSPSQQSSLVLRKQKELPLGAETYKHVCGLGKQAVTKVDPNTIDTSNENKNVNAFPQPVLTNSTSFANSAKYRNVFADNVYTKDKNNDGKLKSDEISVAKNNAANVLNQVVESKITITPVEIKESAAEPQCVEEEADCRPRSPAQDTLIVVPKISWKVSEENAHEDEDNGMESDSLSSDDSLSELDGSEEKSKSPSLVLDRTPPRVEVHDSSGELMVDAGIVEVVNLNVRDQLVDTKVRKAKDKPLKIDLVSCAESGIEGKASGLNSWRSERKRSSVTSDRSSPSTPPSVRGDDSESFHNEATLAALTETELSDWAQDAVVSEDLEDVEYNINPNPQFITLRRHRKHLRKGARVIGARIAKGEDFGDFDDGGHVCGRDNNRDKRQQQTSLEEIQANATSPLMSNIDNIEFMDTGGEDSEADDVLAATNKTLLRNSGYVKFVDSVDEEDDDAKELTTPVVESSDLSQQAVPSVIVSECDGEVDDPSNSPETVELLTEAVNRELISMSAGEEEESSLQPEGGTTTEETSSEVMTVKDGVKEPVLQPPCNGENLPTPSKEPLQPISVISDADFVDDPNGKAYEDYVKRLQGRISPFSNVRDSIDIRKSRRKIKTNLPSAVQELIKEETSEDLLNKSSLNTKFNSPSTSRKLEEITRERCKQKDLIHEMVMDKLLTTRKFPQDKKSKRKGGSSGSPHATPTHSPTNQNNVPPCADVVPDIDDGILCSSAAKSSVPPPTHPRTVIANNDNDGESSEVPLSATFNNHEVEQFYTPMTSFKQKPHLSQPRNRPLSMHASFRATSQADTGFPDKVRSLPDTPLTNPEAFSLPDIRKALFRSPEETFKTPVVPPRAKHEEAKRTVEREKAREEARMRARLKSDEELGLSPEDYIKALKEKVKRHGSESCSATKRPSLTRTFSDPLESSRTSEAESILSSQQKSASRDSLQSDSDKISSSARLSTDLDDSVPFEPLQTSPSAETSTTGTPTSGPNSKTLFYLEPDGLSSTEGEASRGRKKCKDRERRKSIIQAVSDFFHKKKEPSGSPSPPKTPVSGSHSTKEKFSKFKFAKSKDKGKQEKSSPSKSDGKLEKLQTHIADVSNKFGHYSLSSEIVPPPIPPPPANYVGNGPTCRMSEDSLSEADEDSRATALSTSIHEAGSSVDGTPGSLNRKHSRMNRRMVRQAQLKRLRMAQEIQRQLEEVEVKQKELEQRGVRVEKALRGEAAATESQVEEAELLREWFDLMRERSELRRYEKELMVRAQEMELEDRHARLQQELRERMSMDESQKTSEDVAKEGQILRDMLDIVERRDALIAVLEEDRQRYQEEDRDLEAQMLAKGLRLTPLRKESHV